MFLFAIEVVDAIFDNSGMKADTTTKLLLGVIAIALCVITFRPLVSPQPVQAQATTMRALYVEPGTTTLRSPGADRSVTGKVMIDLNTGDVWGFPTLTSAPYPVDATQAAPSVSHPIYLGRFDLAGMKR